MEPQGPPAKLTPEMRQKWNHFVDFVQAQRINPSVLDQRNKQVGMGLLQKFNMSNPSSALPLDIVPKVQGDIQDYRNELVAKWKAGKVAPIEGVKTEGDIMGGISPVDGWPGSKTLSTRFPVATMTNADGTKTNFGTDLDSYNTKVGIK